MLNTQFSASKNSCTTRDQHGRGGAHLLVVACCLGAICALATAGCSGKRVAPWGTAEGKVTVAGQPIPEGTVIFDGVELGVARMAELQSDGSFVQKSIGFPGLPTGKYRVAVKPTRISKGDWVPIEQSKPQKNPAIIPERYYSVATSGLTAEVKEGKNVPFVFDLSN